MRKGVVLRMSGHQRERASERAASCQASSDWGMRRRMCSSRVIKQHLTSMTLQTCSRITRIATIIGIFSYRQSAVNARPNARIALLLMLTHPSQPDGTQPIDDRRTLSAMAFDDQAAMYVILIKCKSLPKKNAEPRWSGCRTRLAHTIDSIDQMHLVRIIERCDMTRECALAVTSES
jgi:hypothetical protein